MLARDEETLAQYFTPQAVVRFAFDALETLGMADAPEAIIDPACGDGEFLLEARRRFPDADIWGTDVDPRLERRWRERGLDGPRDHMTVRDGLARAAGGADRFDLVVGNPPYGLGMSRPKGREPIEVQFLRRFVGLAGDGAWLAVVVPEGVLANRRLQGLRDDVLEAVGVLAVVAFGEATFASTQARTALVIGKKGHRGGEVMLARPDGQAGLEDYLATVLDGMRRGTRG
jgi:type I restriction-modification system DNA methylase subunit